MDVGICVGEIEGLLGENVGSELGLEVGSSRASVTDGVGFKVGANDGLLATTCGLSVGSAEGIEVGGSVPQRFTKTFSNN